jgi:dolichyl-phosphate beta-glucosyltransferase
MSNDKNINISIILPFYNEEKRLNKIFNKILKFQRKYFFNYEFIFVCDGSDDKSYLLVKKFIEKKKRFKLIYYRKNKGKGYALKKGVLKSRFEWILTCDIDLSVKLDFFVSWFNNYNLNKKFSYFGSRNLKNSKVKTNIIRKFIGSIYLFLSKILINNQIRDTQCGYKLYSKNYAFKVFKKLKTPGFSHDIEIINLLNKHNVQIVELPVNWSNVSGSKVNILKDSLIFLITMIKIRLKIL